MSRVDEFGDAHAHVDVTRTFVEAGDHEEEIEVEACDDDSERCKAQLDIDDRRMMDARL